MRRLSFALAAASCILLAACGPSGEAPVINFIGIGTGTLTTDVNAVQFGNVFSPDDLQLIAVVSFEHVEEGTTVMATWFSPDERRMPLGRSTIETQSGAKIARFSFASREPWQAAPYQVRIDAVKGEDEEQMTASGSVNFFIGMEENDIREYLRDFEEWKAAEAEQRAEVERRQAAEQRLVDRAKEIMDSEHGMIVWRDASATDPAFLVADVDPSQGPPGGGAPGILATATAEQYVLIDQSGSTLFSILNARNAKEIREGENIVFDDLPAEGPVTLSLLPSHTIVLTWNEGEKACSLELHRGTEGYGETLQKKCQ